MAHLWFVTVVESYDYPMILGFTDG